MSIAKKKFKDNSYLISENLVRYIALKLKNENLGWFVRVKNAIIFSENPIRFLIRITASVLIGSIEAVTQMVPYAILMLILTFTNATHSGIPCDIYFRQLESRTDQSIVVYPENDTRNLILAANERSGQV